MNKYNSILYLKRPKLLSDIISDPYNQDRRGNLNNTVNHPSYSMKVEKNNKIDNNSIDFIENKKNKSKRKEKSKNYLDKNVTDLRDELDINDMNALSFIKNAKNKKSNKEKNSLNKDILVNRLNDSKDIYLNDLLTVQQLSLKLNVSSTDIIKWLFLQGISVTINQLLDLSISTLVAEHYSFNVLKEDQKVDVVFNNTVSSHLGQSRAPVITLLGHVDHGKTTLLKAIKKDNLPNKEAGNITQIIGSYEILVDSYSNVNKLIFLDTPGHEAFTSMRKRGADITDLVILVVAADDGLKPQTIEAINHIKRRSLPFIVAVNKIDKPEADLEKVKRQLLEFDINGYDNEGNNIIIGVSALNGFNINLLLSSLIDLSKNCNLKSDPSADAEGTILEANLSKQKGPVAQLLIQNGTLHIGDIIVAGNFYGRVKAIHNSMKCKVDYIQSTSLADVLCFTKVPSPGLFFKVVNDEKIAKNLASAYVGTSNNLTILNSRISLDDISTKGVKSIVKQINLIIKTNTQGSIDAIINILAKLPQEKVQINLILVSCGEVSLKDIELASTSNSIILLFNLNLSSSIMRYAEQKGVVVNEFNIIYDLIDYVKTYMLTFVDIDYQKEILGSAEVKNLFLVNKRLVAGCFVIDGKLKRTSYFNIKRANKNIYTGIVDSLKRVKDDVEEVSAGMECGVMCKDYNLWEVKDILECYDMNPLNKTL